jgi:hypothetical protein
MTLHRISETSSTSDESQQKRDVPTSASSEGGLNPSPGMLLAGLVLWAALTTAGAAGTAPIAPYFRRRDEIAAESSTAEVERDPELAKQIEKVFEQGASEFFQDGMHSNFSRSLVAILMQHGRGAFRAISDYVFSGAGNADVISEALRWLADFDDPVTLPQRWAILQHTLKAHSPRVRDGAILGFAALNDPSTRSLLLETKASEPVPELRRLIQQVIDQLNAKHAATPPQR